MEPPPAVLFLNLIQTLDREKPACVDTMCASHTIEDEIQPLLQHYGIGAVRARARLRAAA